jgi:alpha-aminoadipic semialdehyde synthase
MRNKIGIRREDLSKKGEKRVAITPSLAASVLLPEHTVLIQPAVHPETGELKRAFSDESYAAAGAQITEDISGARIIFGLKEVEVSRILPEKVYYIFSHTHKSQPKNREMLRAMAGQKTTLIDYELIADSKDHRLLTAFTYFAGYAGMIDSMWALGQRLKREGISHPFAAIPQSIEKEDLGRIEELVRQVGIEIKTKGLPVALPPLITCFLGNGKTSHGAQQIYNLLPAERIQAEDLPAVFQAGDRNKVYQLVLDIPDMYRLKKDSPYAGQVFSFADFFRLYLQEPNHFESDLARIFPWCTMMMNCIIWAPEYPRLLNRAATREWYAGAQTLRVIGDITCDPEGAIQFSRETWIDDPVFTYDPETQTSEKGFLSGGITVMAVTNLPCEFSADASAGFSKNLEQILPDIVSADYEADSPAESGLPASVQHAVILWKGELAERYRYLDSYLQ